MRACNLQILGDFKLSPIFRLMFLPPIIYSINKWNTNAFDNISRENANLVQDIVWRLLDPKCVPETLGRISNYS